MQLKDSDPLRRLKILVATIITAIGVTTPIPALAVTIDTPRGAVFEVFLENGLGGIDLGHQPEVQNSNVNSLPLSPARTSAAPNSVPRAGEKPPSTGIGGVNSAGTITQQPSVTRQGSSPAIVATTQTSLACNCVLFAKNKTGYNEIIGVARNWRKNSAQPVVGGVVVLNESNPGHVAVITAVRANEFDVIEANYSRCRITTRTINKNYAKILGYWTK